MCTNELLIGYLYDELEPAERETFDRHLASCAECREEVTALRGTRSHLMSWAPPEPDLGFEIVRARSQTASAPPARRWGLSPAWGLAAAAMLTIAASAAIANVEVRFGGSEGLVVRTGWNRTTPLTAQAPAAPAAVSSTDVKRVEARVLQLERQLAERPQAVVAANTTSGATRMSDAEIVRYIRQALLESEQRQSGELARRILQVSRDTEVARRTDVDRLLTAYRQLQGTNFETSQRQNALESLMRVSLQR